MSEKQSKYKKKQRFVKYVWTTRWFQRYQADTVELDKSLTEEGKFNYILTVIDHFSKICMGISTSEKIGWIN